MLDEATRAAEADAVEPFALDPASTSPVLASLARTWHDVLPEDERQTLLRPMLPRLVGTRGPSALDARRAVMAADWSVRCFLAGWLHAAGLKGHAAVLARCPEFTSIADLLVLRPVLDMVAQDANAAWLAARERVKAEVSTEAWLWVREGVRDTVRETAHLTAEAGVRTPIEDAEWAKVEFLVFQAVEACLWTVAWTGLRTIQADGTQARVVAALSPTRAALARSAMALIERMAALGRLHPAPPGARVEGACLFGHDAEVAQWVLARIPEMRGRTWGPCTAIGILRDGELAGGVVYNHFAPHPDGGDVTVNAAFLPSCRITPATMRVMFSYPFEQFGCLRVSDFVIRSNKKARRFAERTGFKLEGIRKHGFGREDIFMFRMTRKECRYL